MKRAPAKYRSSLKVACLLVLIACKSVEPIEKNLFFEGTITATASGAPIAGATVFVGDGTGLVPAIPSNAQSYTSDSQGHYSLPHFGCINNPYVFVRATGYYWDQAKVGCKPATQTVNFSLTRDPSSP